MMGAAGDDKGLQGVTDNGFKVKVHDQGLGLVTKHYGRVDLSFGIIKSFFANPNVVCAAFTNSIISAMIG